jgi:hypothetical protein
LFGTAWAVNDARIAALDANLAGINASRSIGAEVSTPSLSSPSIDIHETEEMVEPAVVVPYAPDFTPDSSDSTLPLETE